MRDPINRARPSLMACVLTCAFALAGCSSVKIYPNSLPKNMQVIAEIDSGAAKPETFVDFDIYRVDSRCKLQYEGRVVLESGKFDVGLPADDLVYLDFIFSSKPTRFSAVNSFSYGTLLKPRPGYRYVARVKYLDGLYSVVLRETSKDGSVNRELEKTPLSACKAH